MVKSKSLVNKTIDICNNSDSYNKLLDINKNMVGV